LLTILVAVFVEVLATRSRRRASAVAMWGTWVQPRQVRAHSKFVSPFLKKLLAGTPPNFEDSGNNHLTVSLLICTVIQRSEKISRRVFYTASDFMEVGVSAFVASMQYV